MYSKLQLDHVLRAAVMPVKLRFDANNQVTRVTPQSAVYKPAVT
jgi:hypothetical protein